MESVPDPFYKAKCGTSFGKIFGKNYVTTMLLQHIFSAICSGETLTDTLAMEFFSVLPEGVTLLNYYGSTETTGDITYEVYTCAEDVRGNLENNCKIWMVQYLD